MKKKYTLPFLLFITCSLSFAQVNRLASSEEMQIDWDICRYHPSGEISNLKILRPNIANQRSTPCSNFIIDFDAGFNNNTDARDAFQFAVDIWAELLDSPIDIRIDANFGPLNPGVLGGAGPNGLIGLNVDGQISFYARPLAEALLGSETSDNNGTADPSDDISPSNDIVSTFSSSANFYFGTDGNVPPGQIDFVTVVLHEIGHGLGILGLGSVPNSMGMPNPNPPVVGQINPGSIPSIWDQFIENGSGVSILDFNDPSADLLNEFQSGDLFSNSPTATAQNSNVNPEIFAPSNFQLGSSYSHWDETVFNNTADALMTPFVANQEVIHNPGNVTLGFMEDMGWTLCQNTLSNEDFLITDVIISPNPFTDNININFLDNTFSEELEIKIIDINGRVVFNTFSNNQEFSVSGLQTLESSFYFLSIESKTSNLKITKKIIKQ